MFLEEEEPRQEPVEEVSGIISIGISIIGFEITVAVIGNREQKNQSNVTSQAN